MTPRGRVILIEIIDLSIAGFLVFGFDLDAVQIKALLTLNYFLNIGLAIAYITFIDSKSKSKVAPEG